MQKSIIALLLLTSAAAFANEASDEQANRTAFSGQRTRAEVKAELEQALKAGSINYGENAGSAPVLAQGERSRDEVRAEAVQAARTRVIHELF